MERRMLLAVVVSFLAVTLYSTVTGRGCMKPPPPAPENGQPENGDGTTPPNGTDPNGMQPPGPGDPPKPPGPGDPPKPPVEPAEPPEDHPHRDLPESTVELESPELTAVFTTRGGSIEYVRLRNQFEQDRKTPFDIVLPVDPTLYLGMTDDTELLPPEAPGGADRRDLPAGPMRTLNWRRDEAAEAATPETDVVFVYEAGGIRYTKRWIMPSEAERYDVRLELGARATGETDRTSVPVKLLVSGGQLRELRQGMDMFQQNKAVFLLSTDDEPSEQNTWGLGVTELETKGLQIPRLRLLGSRSLYFVTAYFHPGGAAEPPIVRFWATGEDAAKRPAMEERLAAFYKQRDGVDLLGAAADPDLAARVKQGVQELQQVWLVLDLPLDAQAAPVEIPIYVGPMARSALQQDGYESLSNLILFPFAPDFVADILIGIYDLWLGLFGSAGLAVILMTLVVRGLMMPLSIRNQLSMRQYGRKVAKIKPKVQALQKKFAKNPKRLREEQMKLYREHGIGFPGGCLMMLLQIPIWFALFSSLRREYSLRGAEFLWISDLSGPDALIPFDFTLNLMVLQVSAINLLPILMVTLSIIHTRQMPKPADEQTAQQYRMMKWMPIIFAVILYNYTAALLLYMVISSALGIVEMKIVRRKDENAQAEGGAPARPAPAGA